MSTVTIRRFFATKQVCALGVIQNINVPKVATSLRTGIKPVASTSRCGDCAAALRRQSAYGYFVGKMSSILALMVPAIAPHVIKFMNEVCPGLTLNSQPQLASRLDAQGVASYPHEQTPNMAKM